MNINLQRNALSNWVIAVTLIAVGLLMNAQPVHADKHATKQETLTFIKGTIEACGYTKVSINDDILRIRFADRTSTYEVDLTEISDAYSIVSRVMNTEFRTAQIRCLGKYGACISETPQSGKRRKRADMGVGYGCNSSQDVALIKAFNYLITKIYKTPKPLF